MENVIILTHKIQNIFLCTSQTMLPVCFMVYNSLQDPTIFQLEQERFEQFKKHLFSCKHNPIKHKAQTTKSLAMMLTIHSQKNLHCEVFFLGGRGSWRGSLAPQNFMCSQLSGHVCRPDCVSRGPTQKASGVGLLS